MDNKSTKRISTRTVKINEKTELEALRARVAELENGGEEPKIPLDDLISVMSLIPYTLVLATKPYGQGKLTKFERFGQIKKILYKDLIDILETSLRFLEGGYYIILDKRVVKAHGLEESYQKILTKDKILSILNGSSDDYAELYTSCNPMQQEIIVSMIVEKLRDAPESMDMNIVDKISRLSKVNISEKVKDARFILKKDSKSEEE